MKHKAELQSHLKIFSLNVCKLSKLLGKGTWIGILAGAEKKFPQVECVSELPGQRLWEQNHVFRESAVPENATLSWLILPSIKGQFVSFLKSLFPCLDLGAPVHLEKVGLLFCRIGCLHIRDNYKQIKLHKLKVWVPVIKPVVIELNRVWGTRSELYILLWAIRAKRLLFGGQGCIDKAHPLRKLLENGVFH